MMDVATTRRAAIALTLVHPWLHGMPWPANAAQLSCPRWKPTDSGCVSSLPSSAPNQIMAPLRYGGDRNKAYSRLRATLLSQAGAELVSDIPEALCVRLPTLDASQTSLFEELTFCFLPDEPIVTFRIVADRPYASQPFCVTPGCIVGNAAQRKRLETLRDEVGFMSVSDPTAEGKWVPIFFNSGIDLGDY